MVLEHIAQGEIMQMRDSWDKKLRCESIPAHIAQLHSDALLLIEAGGLRLLVLG